MPPEDFVDLIMTTGTDRHGQFHLLAFDLVRIKTRLRSQHIIERRQMITAPGTKKDTEILGVPVRRANQPEQDLRLQNNFLITGRIIAALEQIKYLNHPRPPVALIFPGGRHRQGLATIFLRQTQQPLILRPAPVEPLNDQCLYVFPNVCMSATCDRQAEGGSQFEAVKFIFDAV